MKKNISKDIYEKIYKFKIKDLENKIKGFKIETTTKTEITMQFNAYKSYIQLCEQQKLEVIIKNQYETVKQKYIILHNPKLEYFFRTLREYTINGISGAKSAQPNFMSMSTTDEASKINQLKGLSKYIPNPIVSSALNIGLDKLAEQKQNEFTSEIRDISKLTEGFSQIDHLADNLAVKLTMRYQQQIELLDNSKPGKNSIWEFATEIWNRIRKSSAEANTSENIVDNLIESISKSRRPFIQRLLSGEKKLQTAAPKTKNGYSPLMAKLINFIPFVKKIEKGQIIHETTTQGLINRSGIYIINKDGSISFYEGDGVDWQTNGFRNGTLNEATKLGLRDITIVTEKTDPDYDQSKEEAYNRMTKEVKDMLLLQEDELLIKNLASSSKTSYGAINTAIGLENNNTATQVPDQKQNSSNTNSTATADNTSQEVTTGLVASSLAGMLQTSSPTESSKQVPNGDAEKKTEGEEHANYLNKLYSNNPY